MTGSHHLEPSDPGTRHTLSIEFSGLLASLFAPMLRRLIVSTLVKENQGFKSAAEES